MDAFDLIERYFRCLESGDFVEAANCFSESARYSHPPYAEEPPGAGRHEVQGRAAVLALFHRRGLRSTRHEITGRARSGDRCYLSGTVKDPGGSVVASFVSHAVFDRDLCQFTEYVAYSSRPAVWAASGRP